jgi:hypothetical protein
VHEDGRRIGNRKTQRRSRARQLQKPDANFDAILASNDGTAGGAIQALSEEGLAGKVLVTGQDAELSAASGSSTALQAMTIYKPLLAACQTSRGGGNENGEKQTSFRSRQDQQRENRSALNSARCGCRHKGKHDGHRS